MHIEPQRWVVQVAAGSVETTMKSEIGIDLLVGCDNFNLLMLDMTQYKAMDKTRKYWSLY